MGSFAGGSWTPVTFKSDTFDVDLNGTTQHTQGFGSVYARKVRKILNTKVKSTGLIQK